MTRRNDKMTETKVVYPVGNYSILLLQDSDQSPIISCAALLVLLVLTLTLNSLVLLSAMGSPLRWSPHNTSIATVAGVSLLEGVFNLTSSVVFHASWSELPHLYGENAVRVWCKSNASILQVDAVIFSFALAVLSYDRLSAINERRVGDFPTRRKEKLRTVLKWVLLLSVFGSVILTIPVALGVLTTTLFEQRMSCSPAYVSEQPEDCLIAVVILATYFATWLFTLRNSYIIVKKVLNERRRLIGLELVARQRAAERGSPQRITNSNVELWCQVWGTANGESISAYILTGLLIMSFMLSVVPNVLFVQVTQFFVVYDTPQEFYVMNRTFPELRQIRTDVFDSIFAWTRHGYNAFSPGLILLMHDEIRKQCKVTFCCCFMGGNTYVKKQSRSVSAFVREWKWQKKKKTFADYRTPVLFATSQGLHLRTVRGDGLEPEEPQFVIKFCDVTLDEGTLSKQPTPVMVKPKTEFHEPKLNETYVVKPDVRRFGETFVKSPAGFDISKTSRNRNGTIELGLIAENGRSLLSLSQRMRHRDS